MLVLALPLALTLAAWSPPSGRPPEGPLRRVEPRIYDVRFEVQISSVPTPEFAYRPNIELANTPIVMPVIFQGTYSSVDPQSLTSRLWYESREDTTLAQRNRIDGSHPFGTSLAIMTIPSFRGQSLRWQIAFRTQVWSSQIDDAAAGRLTWPREWPEEVQDGLKPQQYVESDDPVFAQTVQRITEGKLRLVPPYFAAKDIVRYCIGEIQVVGDGEDRRELKLLHGMELWGALNTATSGRGGPHDLVCVCVAMLRAAGIPARPVVGIQEDALGVVRFVSWGELYLQGAGWIPFDPNELRGNGARHKDVREPWKDFGTLKDLNRRITLAYHYMPPVAVQSPQAPAVWGWDPQPRQPPSHEQFVNLQIISRGRAPEGPVGR